MQPCDKGMIDLFSCMGRQSTFSRSNLITVNKREKMGGYETELMRRGVGDKKMREQGEERVN